MSTPPHHGRQNALLREAVHRLADSVAPYRVLTRAVDHGVLRRLDADLYETTRA
jgi:hypothetical protein